MRVFPFKKTIQNGFPIYLLGIFVLAFGLQVPRLGYVLDDWVILYAHYAGGNQNLAQYAFLINRPNLTWIWEAGIALLGYNAIRWQLFSLFWRYLAVVVTWMGWKQLWPNHKSEISLAAGLFAVYPIFNQQSAAISFSVHWVCLTFYAASILLMIMAVKSQRFPIPLLAASLFLGAVNVFSMEYFVGLELLRPVIVWLLLVDESLSKTQRIKKVFALWLPFLLMLAVYLLYRFVWMPTPGYDRNTPELLKNLISSPISTTLNLLLGAVRDLIQSVFGSWSATIQSSDINFDTPASIVALGVVVVTALFSVGFYFIQVKSENNLLQKTGRFYQSAIFYGLLAIIFGLLPVWAIGQGITSPSQYSDRFSMPILAGASLVVIGVLDWLSQDFAPKIVVAGVFAGLAAGFQFRAETINRYSWEMQLNTYWQLKWRIPAMKPATALYGDGVLARFMGSWVDDAAYNTLYPARSADGFDGTWFFDLYKLSGSDLKPNVILNEKKMENLRFEGNSSNSLVIQMHGKPGQCVWLVTSADNENPYISDTIKPVLALTNLDRVIGNIPSSLPQEIYGPEIEHTWCYFFEKADLDRQYGQWDEIVKLWNEAQSKKVRPNVPVEYVPFIQGAAHTGNWDMALEITKAANFPSDINGNFLCGIWKNLLTNPDANSDIQAKAQDLLKCNLLK